MKLSVQDTNAILAGLRLLQSALDKGTVVADDGDVGDILTNSGECTPHTADSIDELCERLNGS
jgi:hypothetical protein